MRDGLMEVVNIVSKYTSRFELTVFKSGRLKLKLRDKKDIGLITRELSGFDVEIV